MASRECLAPHDLDRRKLATRLAAGAIVAGLLLCVVALSVPPNAAAYLAGLSLGLAGLVALCVLCLRRSQMLLAIAAAFSLIASAVAIPLHLANQRSNIDSLWSVDLESWANYVHVTSDRVLVSDDGGLKAFSLSDGKLLWKFSGPVLGFEVSGDGYAFVRSVGSDEDRSSAWIDPNGTVLWQRDEAESGAIPQVDGKAVAAVGESLVISACEGIGESSSCDFSGIDGDGHVQWEIEGAASSGSLGPLSSPSPLGSPETLPAMLVHGLAPPDSEAVVRDPVTGDVLHEFEIQKPDEQRGARWPAALVGGEVLVHEEGPAKESGMCVWRGWGAGGDVMWDEELPCLDGQLTVAGSFAYAQYRADEGGSRRGWALDAETGSWTDVGDLDSYGQRHDVFASASAPIGIPGPGLVVQRADHQLVALDPRSGGTVWTFSADGPVDLRRVGGETVVAKVRASPSRNPLVSSTQRTEDDTVMLDAHTGSVKGRFGSESRLSFIAPARSGTAVIAFGSTLALVGDQA